MKIVVFLIVAAFAFASSETVVNVTEECDPAVTQVAEVAFVLDGSSSIRTTNWPKVKNFVKSIVQSYIIGPDNVRVAIVLFSHKLSEEVPLDAFDEKDDIITEIENLRYIKGSTFTHKALAKVRTDTLAPANCRDDTPRIAIVFTDGRSRYVDKTAEEALLLRQSGVSVIAIGVKDARESELINIAGSSDNIYYVDDFDDMTSLIEPVTKITCEQSQTVCVTTQKAEVAFVIDGSSSITSAHWPMILEFVSSVTGSFPLGQDAVRVAAILFSHKVQKEIGLDDYSNVTSIQEAIEDLPFIKGSTFTHKALDTACNDVLHTNNTRDGVRRLVILITDGRSRYPPHTLENAYDCRNNGISILAVGVGSARVTELEDVTGDVNKVYFADEIDEIMGLANSLKETTCTEIKKEDP